MVGLRGGGHVVFSLDPLGSAELVGVRGIRKVRSSKGGKRAAVKCAAGTEKGMEFWEENV